MIFNFLNRDKEDCKNSFKSDSINSFVQNLNEHLKTNTNKPIIEDGLYQIDRFEGDDKIFAVCQNLETKKMFNIPKDDIPENASYAYVLKAESGTFTIDYDETRKYVKNI
jgi:Protein of unknown function (DUF3006).